MPKLLIINITCNQGSVGKISEQIGLMMKGRGWDVYLAHGARRVNPSQLNTFPFSSVKEEYYHALKSLLFDADGLGSKESTKKLVNYIKEIKPDVIQIHNLHGYYLNYKILFEYLHSTNTPVVLTLHDCWPMTGHCVHPIIANCDKWKIGCNHCKLKIKYPKMSLIDRSEHNYQDKRAFIGSYKNLTIVTVSEWLAAVARQSLLKDRKIIVIENGVDLNIFSPRQKNKKTTFDIIAVSNVWHKDKGLFDFIELSKYLKKDERILLVGYNSKKSKNDLLDNIIPIAYTRGQEELAQLYSDSDVVVSMSYAETFGLTIAEGNACGIPAVVYDNTAQPSLIGEDNGIVVPTGNVRSIYEAISVIRQKGFSYYKDNCRGYALQNFNKDECFLKYVELYESLVNASC